METKILAKTKKFLLSQIITNKNFVVFQLCGLVLLTVFHYPLSQRFLTRNARSVCRQ